MSGLRVAVIHYHLKRGGVTRVIESTIDGLQSLHGDRVECAVLSGQVPSQFKHADKAIQVNGLNYSSLQERTPDPETLLKAVQQAARKRLGADPDVWHIHNHSLGKNSSMPGLVSLLVQSGQSVLLHMHDFAEDGRPENYLLNKAIPEYADALYPDAENAHYGFINSRDREVFRTSGIPSQRLHYLGNPVGGPMEQLRSEASSAIRRQLDAERLFLYPVRAVRRKNFGEMLLWSALADPGDVFATTLGPTNPNYQQQYRAWRDFAHELQLPVRFSIGESAKWAFPDIVSSADFILTTSIAEGFGLTFLEPCLFGKLILGRDLPDVTIDFTETGLPTAHLYTDLPIPVEWVEREQLVNCLRQGLLASYEAYNTTPPADFLEQALAAITTGNGSIDFGGLNESLQQSVIKRISDDPAEREHLNCCSLVPERLPALDFVNLDDFSIRNYTRTVFETYRIIASSSSHFSGFFDDRRILLEYLKPSRFRLLRT